MDRVDYAKSLNSERSKFYDSLENLKESQNKEITALKTQQEHQLKQKRKAYDGDIDNLEERYTEREKKMSKFIKTELEDKKDALRDKLSDVRRDFSKRSTEQQQDYRKRMDSLNNQFQDNTAEKEEMFSKMLNERDRNQKENLTNYIKKSDGKIKDLTSSYNEQADELKEHYLEEKQGSERLHQRKLRTLSKEESNKRAKLRGETNRTLDSQNRSAKSNLEASRRAYYDNLGELKEKYLENNQKTVQNFEEINEKQNVRFMATQDKQEQEHNREMEKQKANYERKLSLNDNFGNKRNDMNQLKSQYDSNILKERGRYHTRLDRIRKNNEKSLSNIENQMANRNQQALVDQGHKKLEQTQKEAVLRKEMSLQNSRNLSSERNKNTNMKDDYDTLIKNLNNTQHNEIVKMKRQHSSEKGSLTKQHGLQIEDQELRYAENLEGIRADDIQDKRLFTRKLQRESYGREHGVKTDYLFNMANQKRGYEDQVSQLENSKDRIESNYNSKFQMLQKAKAEEIVAQNEFHHDQNLSKDEEHRQDLQIRESKLLSEMQAVRRDYGQKLTEQGVDSERMVNQLTSRYEAKLRSQGKELRKEMQQQATQNKIIQDRLKSDFESRKERLITHYENTIQELKNNHSHEVDNLNAFIREERSKA